MKEQLIDTTTPASPTVLVLGDVMRDIYYTGSTRRQSAEAPIPVIEVEEVVECPGGAANVAENLQALGASTVLLARQPFPIKSRVMLGNEQVCRFDQDDRCLPITYSLLASIGRKIQPDAVVVADYGKGGIVPVEMAEEIIEFCVEQKIPLFINTKRDPSEWLINPDLDVTFVTNRSEYEQWSDAYRRASQVIITQGADGVVRQSSEERCPAFTSPSDVVSVNGAGDTFLAAYVYAVLTNNYDPLTFANAASAVVVRKPFTSTATASEVNQVIYSQCKAVA